MNRLVSAKIAGICILLMFVRQTGAEVFLPGMQPKESGIEFVKVQQCKCATLERRMAQPIRSFHGKAA